MARKIAIKRLTASDLTFFTHHFRTLNAGNQKSINLNAEVFVDALFPGLSAYTPGTEANLPITLRIHGPGLSDEYSLRRKIIKNASYKNWRLNGELIYDPDSEPTRFHDLQPGDLAILEFVGDERAPHTVRMSLLARANRHDQPLHTAINRLLEGRSRHSMVAISTMALEEAVTNSSADVAHPLYGFALEEALEDAALGGIGGARRLRGIRSAAAVTAADLREARESAERIGALGEELLDRYFEELALRGEIEEYSWESQRNAISPFDFVVKANGVEERIDAKSTNGQFDRPVHISMNELETICDPSVVYRIYRLYELTGSSFRMRKSVDLRSAMQGVHNLLGQLPRGVKVDGIAVDPKGLEFEDAIAFAVDDRED